MDRYEGIDYAEAQSLLNRLESMKGCDGAGGGARGGRDSLKWLMFIAVGLAVGCWSVLIFQTLEYLADMKLEAVEGVIVGSGADATPAASPVLTWVDASRGYFFYVGWGVCTALLSSLCCLVMPSAAGSGIPDVMAFLNGVMFPRIFNIRNLVVKSLSCILAVSAGLPVGTEGPMIHMGALIGAGLSTGRSRSLRCSATSLFDVFRNPRDQRDFISAGAACGLTSAFSSPLGGMLFVLEEMATHFSVQLAWQVLLSCLSCMFVIEVVNSYWSGWKWATEPQAAAGHLRESAIAMFYIDTVPENTVPLNSFTFLPTIVIAVISGLLAVLYTVSSIGLTRWRSRSLFPCALYRVLEPCVFALFFCSVCYALPLATPCIAIPPAVQQNQHLLHVDLFTAFCADPSTTYHPLATLLMTNPYNLLRLLFSRRTAGLFPAWALILHLILYTAGSSYAGGMFISCGTVVPSLLIGAVLGRLVGQLFGEPVWADEGVTALIGAASYFSGISRLTFALVVIMMELTADLSHVTCLMLGILLAKAVADVGCHPFYHASLEVKAVPFLEAQTSIHLLDLYAAKDIMTAPATTVETIDRVLHIVEVLTSTTHHAFPVVRVGADDGVYDGLISRELLELLLWVVYLRECGETDDENEPEAAQHSPRYQPAHSAVAADEKGGNETLQAAPPTAASATAKTAPTTLPGDAHISVTELKRVREYRFWRRLHGIPPMEHLSIQRMRSFLDLRPYVDGSAPFVSELICVSRAYYLFRHLSLRHLPVLDRSLQVTGILTRVNFVGDRLRDAVQRVQFDGQSGYDGDITEPLIR